MKEIPILFSTPMVQAILEGRKTQTRRIMAPQIEPCKHGEFKYAGWKDEPTQFIESSQYKGYWYCKYCGNGTGFANLFEGIKCPFGTKDDILWVRETHYAYGWWVQEGVSKTGKLRWTFKDFTMADKDGEYHYETNPPANIIERRSSRRMGWYRRPAIFMPYQAARIWLKKTATKVERACEISHEDAISEGLACITKDGGRTYKYGIPDLDGYPGIDNVGWPWDEWAVDAIKAFQKLWNIINGPETWNNWVWANSFETLSTTGRPNV